MKFFPVSAVLLFFAFAVNAQSANRLSDAEIQGRLLAGQILEQEPAENFTNTGVLVVRGENDKRINVPIRCEATVTATYWQSVYEINWTSRIEKLFIVHSATENLTYFYYTNYSAGQFPASGDISVSGDLSHRVSGKELMTPFGDSDFSLADLGLEFLHWPEQKILKKEVHRSRGCTVLESTNPNPSANNYSRVVSWIDNETFGIVEAYAYDADGKKLKNFYPKDFKKINGQWQVQTLVMKNLQTDSRSQMEFDLKK